MVDIIESYGECGFTICCRILSFDHGLKFGYNKRREEVFMRKFMMNEFKKMPFFKMMPWMHHIFHMKMPMHLSKHGNRHPFKGGKKH